jgi:hypothetical protein
MGKKEQIMGYAFVFCCSFVLLLGVTVCDSKPPEKDEIKMELPHTIHKIACHSLPVAQWGTNHTAEYLAAGYLVIDEKTDVANILSRLELKKVNCRPYGSELSLLSVGPPVVSVGYEIEVSKCLQADKQIDVDIVILHNDALPARQCCLLVPVVETSLGHLPQGRYTVNVRWMFQSKGASSQTTETSLVHVVE